MVHYILLKLTKDADVTSIYFRCRKACAELEMELPFVHDTDVGHASGRPGISERLSAPSQAAGAGERDEGLCVGANVL